MDSFDRRVTGIIAGLVAAIALIIALGDRVGVTVTSSVAGGGQNPSVGAPIRLSFSQPMDTASVEDHFSIQPPVEGKSRWEGNTLIFQPDRALEPQQTYTITLEEGAQSLLDQQVIKTLAWSFTPRPPGVLYLAPANSDPLSLWFAALDGSPPRQIYAPEYGITDFAPGPDGEQIAVTVYDSNKAADIWLIDAAGGNPRRITDCQPGFCGGPAWSPDGKKLAFERQEPSPTGGSGPSRVWLYDLAGGQSAPVFQDNQVLGFGPVWSSDGKRLAFFDGNSQGIRVVDLPSGDTFRLPSLMGEAGSFSPDGSQMVYTNIRQVGGQFFAHIVLARLSAEGGFLPLVDEAEEDQFPAWSPDGKWIAFGRRALNRKDGFGSQLMIYDPASGQLRQLTDDADFNNTNFVWSPASDQILLHRFDLTTSHAAIGLWVYHLSDGRLTKVVDNAFGGRWLP